VAIIGLGLILFLKSVYGLAGSLNELQSQVTNETGYRGELEGYITLHNLTFGI